KRKLISARAHGSSRLRASGARPGCSALCSVTAARRIAKPPTLDLMVASRPLVLASYVIPMRQWSRIAGKLPEADNRTGRTNEPIASGRCYSLHGPEASRRQDVE